MNRFILPVFVIAIISGSVFLFINKKNTTSSAPNTITTQNQNEIELTPQITITETQKNNAVPTPSENDIINTFFNLINEKRIPEAISMMDVYDETTKQAWGVQFNAFESVTLTKIDAYNQDSWSPTEHIYKVTISAKMSPESASAPIPYYGWDTNPNIRWVTIVKIGNLWKIKGIATGP